MDETTRKIVVLVGRTAFFIASKQKLFVIGLNVN